MWRTAGSVSITLLVASLGGSCGPAGEDDDTGPVDDDTSPDDDTGPVDDDIAPDDDTGPVDDDTGPVDDDTTPDDDTAPDDDTTPDDDTGPDDDSAPVDGDGDGYPADADCDDTDPGIHPGAAETCDAVDQDCDGLLDDCPLEGVIDLSTAGARIDSTEGDAGYSLSGAGDVNGDGYDDIILGNPGGTAWGLAYVFFGPVLGHLDVSAADVRLECDGELGAYFGWSVTGGGDMDGDGYGDLAVGAPFGNDGAAAYVYVFHGPLSGTILSSDYSGRIRGTSEYWGSMGYGVTIAGDVTGDGLDDLWVSAQGAFGTGAAFLFAGPVLGAHSYVEAVGYVTPGADGMAGNQVAGATDLDGDGFGDLLYGGNSTGAKVIGGDLTGGITGDSALATLWGEADLGARWEFAVAGPGDVNGDGVGDVLIGDASYSDTHDGQGAAYLFLGPLSDDLDASAADLKLTGEAEYAYSGRAVAGPGDVDGDGFADILIGSYQNPAGPAVAGSVYLLYGPTAAGVHSLADADARFDSPPDALGAGAALAGAGDLNADGYDDFITTAIGPIASPIDSAVFVVYGRPR